MILRKQIVTISAVRCVPHCRQDKGVDYMPVVVTHILNSIENVPQYCLDFFNKFSDVFFVVFRIDFSS